MLYNERWVVLRKFLNTCNIACDIKVVLWEYQGHSEVFVAHANETSDLCIICLCIWYYSATESVFLYEILIWNRQRLCEGKFMAGKDNGLHICLKIIWLFKYISKISSFTGSLFAMISKRNNAHTWGSVCVHVRCAQCAP